VNLNRIPTLLVFTIVIAAVACSDTTSKDPAEIVIRDIEATVAAAVVEALANVEAQPVESPDIQATVVAAVSATSIASISTESPSLNPETISVPSATAIATEQPLPTPIAIAVPTPTAVPAPTPIPLIRYIDVSGDWSIEVPHGMQLEITRADEAGGQTVDARFDRQQDDANFLNLTVQIFPVLANSLPDLDACEQSMRSGLASQEGVTVEDIALGASLGRLLEVPTTRGTPLIFVCSIDAPELVIMSGAASPVDQSAVLVRIISSFRWSPSSSSTAILIPTPTPVPTRVPATLNVDPGFARVAQTGLDFRLVGATVTSTGSDDIFTVVIDWSDGLGLVPVEGVHPSGEVLAGKIYSTPGIRAVRIQATNQFGETAEATFNVEVKFGFSAPQPTTPQPTPTTAPVTTIGDGIWTVGSGVSSGTYSNGGGSFCYWARLSGFSGEFDDIIANGISSSPQIVTISSGDVGFESSGCGVWTKTGG
jgi:hypothetical protein